jgi:hypothetical protein
MGNFLSNLARRSFTPGGGIRPRPASLFESAGVVPGAWENPAEDLAPIEAALLPGAEAETIAPPEEPEGLSLLLPRPKNRKSPVRIADSSSEHDSSLRNTLKAEPAPPSSEKGSGRQRLSPGPPTQTMVSVKSELNTPQVAGLESHATAIMSGRTVAGAPAPFPATVRRDDHRPIENERSAPLPPGASMVAEVAAPERPQTRSGLDVIPLSTNVVNRNSTAGPPMTPSVVRARKPSNRKIGDSHPEAEPAIHVTIGRVEVRAEVGGHLPSRADRAPSPVMSLDEYLRRRAKRGVE